MPHVGLVDRWPNVEAKNTAYDVIKVLAEMDFVAVGAELDDERCIPFFRFDDDAQLAFVDWFNDLDLKLRKEDEPIINEHLGKYRSLMPSLALLFHLIDLASGVSTSPRISLTSTRKAAAFCDYLESHARGIYGQVMDIDIEAAK